MTGFALDDLGAPATGMAGLSVNPGESLPPPTMTLVSTMILGPLAAGLGMFCLRLDNVRRALVVTVTCAVALGALALAQLPMPASLPLDAHFIGQGMLLGNVVMGAGVLWIGYQARRPLILLMAAAQTGLMVWFEWFHGHENSLVSNLFIDQFSVIMALVNGLVGGGICLYALSYMRDYHEAHREIADRRRLFFGLLFVFMGAMFGLVFSNNLVWFHFFWEITTLCSFFLIGYSQKPEARHNALRALTVNMAGGLAFAAAIVILHRNTGSIELRSFTSGQAPMVLLPAILLSVAGLTKSAQLPFSNWLLGAMVAPTPVSALLHSSTMVKAGVYLVLRMAPVLSGTSAGLMIALIGAMTFLVASLAAISARDAKKLLAYSTIANLGLIVMCGGIGTAEAVWAGILLIIFHALAKCLLFLSVGVVEHHLHSRDIEDMSGLILAMPRVAVMMLIGMAGMFLAPFGMLISKWAVLKAVVDTYPLLSVFIVFGSSATLFFWVKWMGKLLETSSSPPGVKEDLGLGEGLTLGLLALLTSATCLGFPFLSSRFIEPHVAHVFGQSVAMSQGNILIMTLMMAVILLFPLSFLNYGRGVKVMDPYLGGANRAGRACYQGAMGRRRELRLENYYLRHVLPEPLLLRWGVFACSGMWCVLLAMALL
jgi:ech hydrogenase subunit A